MIINSLTVTDFRVFRGEQTFDLAPRVKYGTKRPIVLFGGLNGAGKTSILSAVKLALYGRQSLGYSISQKYYDQHLIASIHQSKNSLVQTQHAAVEVNFSYAHMGIIHEYTATRSWLKKGVKVTESLQVSEDGKPLVELSNEQCQGFLNELIPIGVSDLFFFDGEKIAELAEDTAGEALGNSIKRLLGLDQIESLQTDLSTLLRQHRETESSAANRKKTDELKKTLIASKEEAESWETNLHKLNEQFITLNEEIARIELKLSENGGAWAQSRETGIQSLTTLEDEKNQVEEQIREAISSAFPLSIPKILIKRLLTQLESEAEDVAEQAYTTEIDNRVAKLKKRLQTDYTTETVKDILKTIDETLRSNQKKEHSNVLHGISTGQLTALKNILQLANSERKQLEVLNNKLIAILEKIENIEANLARAPEQSTLQKLMDQLLKTQKKKGKISAEYSNGLEHRRRALRNAMDCVRQLKKYETNTIADQQGNRVHDYAQSAKHILKTFALKMAERKIQDLESEFLLSISKFSRKEDTNMRVKIHPETFSVDLERKDGTVINKNELSAGEKQIYAISILQALANTSDRKLPIIIDTPLGRLDSHHRSNLVNRYFPSASHQVIVLSTDTEIDQKHYQEFSPHISHAFQLQYDSTEGCSNVKEGYFWKTKTEKEEMTA